MERLFLLVLICCVFVIIGSVNMAFHLTKIVYCDRSGMGDSDFIHHYNSGIKGDDAIYPDIEDFYKRNVNWISAEEFIFEINSNKISCTLIYPVNKNFRGMIVAVAGDGDISYRTSWIDGALPFWRTIVEHLVRSGFMVLLYDKPGVGLSEGDWVRQTIKDRSEELSSIVDRIMESDRINNVPLGLLGFSEGGLVVELMAINDSRVSFVVTLSTPAVSIKEVMIDEGLCILKRRKLSEFETAIRSLFIIARFNAIRVISEFYRRNEHIYYTIDYDPSGAISRLNVPLLAVFGRNDCIVDTSKNVERLRMFFGEETGNSSLFIKVIDNVDHLFKDLKVGLSGPDSVTISGELLEALSTEEFWNRVFLSDIQSR